MGFLAIMGLVTLVSGGLLLTITTSNKPKPITMPSSFYRTLKYFRLENGKVVAVKKDDEDDEIIYTGSASNASKYLEQVQLGFEEWLQSNDHFTKSESKVTFN